VNATWRTLIEGLGRATSFHEAADGLLAAVCDLCEEEVGRLFPDAGARVLRALVHVRPADGYRCVAVHTRRDSSASLAPSATAWRWVSGSGGPVAIDVHIGVVEAHRGELVDVLQEPGASSTLWETQRVLLDRDASHLLALPLRGLGGELAGMVTVELDCRAAIGLPVWTPDGVGLAQALVDSAALYLLSLPSPPSTSSREHPLLPVVGASMRSIVATLESFAAQDDTLLLSGPTGVGKSRLAQWCHSVSKRSGKPFEVVHLAAQPEGLRMAELFGWRRGAFTGAVNDHVGSLGRAQGGTLFLDEVDKLSLEDQTGLLRLLEEAKYRPLGDASRDHTADVRFVLGTNVDLPAQVRAGTFREDLFYRINVLPVRVPPLAERKDEIASWARFMLARRHSEAQSGVDAMMAEDAARVLAGREWPGNLRQLDNVVRRAYALMSGEAQSRHRALLEARHIDRALAFEGNIPSRGLIDLMQAAATAFVLEAERRPSDRPLDLDLATALRGLVLAAATEKLGNVKDAFRLFGKDSLIQHRNHSKVLREELARVEEIKRAVSGESGRELED
jgi:DNA-binding NtrC family response regulator